MGRKITVGVLALQGAFYEHFPLLQNAADRLEREHGLPASQWDFTEVRTVSQLGRCDAMILPGGESTTISLVAERSSLLEPLRDFVKYVAFSELSLTSDVCSHPGLLSRRTERNPTWGTCAGLILLAESANRTKKGGQELIGGLDIRVNRNHFGRQIESFQMPLELPFLSSIGSPSQAHLPPFTGVFIRAPIVEKILPSRQGIQVEESQREQTVVAPSNQAKDRAAERAESHQVEVLATLPGRAAKVTTNGMTSIPEKDAGGIIAVRQGNVFGTSFHPELTDDPRIHMWWLCQVQEAVNKTQDAGNLPLRPST
jgi:pyridoxal 5'-phosphate synthase pdxT subunit